jgi:hypothetical protein
MAAVLPSTVPLAEKLPPKRMQITYGAGAVAAALGLRGSGMNMALFSYQFFR